MYKIGIIGERDSVLGYMAIGFSVHEAADAAEAGRILHRLAQDESYAIIFIVENYAAEMEADIAAYRDKPLPAIVTLPGKDGSTGYGMAALKTAVERAVGADILFKGNE